MGYSCTDIPVPRVKTDKLVIGLEGATVWLVAGEGASPKRYYLTSRFIIDKCEQNKDIGTRLSNEVSGSGVLLGMSVPLNTTSILKQVMRLSANFVNGFFELRDPDAIAALKTLA